MVHTLTEDHHGACLRVLGSLAVAAVVSVGEKPGPVDLPVVHDTPVLALLVLVNDDGLGCVFVPTQSELRHVQLVEQKLISAHIIEIAVHFIFVDS